MGYATSRNVPDGGPGIGSGSRLPDEDEAVDRKPLRMLQGTVTALLRDMARLMDLQFQLLSMDLQQVWVELRWKLLAVALAGAAIMGCMPIVLAGIALLLQEQFAWSIATSLLVVGLAISIFAAAIAGYILSTTGNVMKILRSSREEFQVNMNWFRTMLHNDETDE